MCTLPVELLLLQVCAGQHHHHRRRQLSSRQHCHPQGCLHPQLLLLLLLLLLLVCQCPWVCWTAAETSP
jgi:hypothetical protein